MRCLVCLAEEVQRKSCARVINKIDITLLSY